MTIWIDTAGADSACGLFGLTPLERHLRTLAKQHSALRIVLSGPRQALPDDAVPGIEYRMETGPVGTRFASFLRETDCAVVIALDGGSVADPRLIAYFLNNPSSRAAFGGEDHERATILSLRLLDAERVPPDSQTVLAVAQALADTGSVEVLTQEDFPSFVTNLRRSVPFYVFAVHDEETRRKREEWLFRVNYKGSTDFLGFVRSQGSLPRALPADRFPSPF